MRQQVKNQKDKVKSAVWGFFKGPLFLTFYFLLFTFSLAYASSNAGSTNGNFLELPTDARGVSMGQAMISMARGSESLRWNPAGMAATDNPELSATYVQYFQGVQIENAAYSQPLENGAIGGSLFYLTAGSLDGRDDLGNATGNFQFYDLVGTLGYAQKIMTRAEGMDIQAGAAIKVVQEVIADQSFQNPALDAGILISPVPEWNIGAAMRNLATSKADFPLDFGVGTSYTMLRQLTGAVDINYYGDAPVSLNIGAEYKFEEFNSAVRAGYMTHNSIDDSQDSQITFLRSGGIAGLTAGAGFEWPVPFAAGLKLNFDYAIAPFGALGISHYITVKAKW
jgi:hypothetical protein